MNKKMLITLGITGLMLINTGFSFATNSNVIEKSKKVDYSVSQDYYNSIEKTITENGKKYELQDVERKDNLKTESKKYETIEEKIVEASKKSSAINMFEETKNIEDDGFKGTISKEDSSIELTPADSYKEEYKVYLQRKYTNVSSNELNDVPKELKENGLTYYLVNPVWDVTETEEVDGKQVPVKYSGTMKYEGKNTRTVVTSYVAKVKYTGILEKQVKDTTTFTAKYKEIESAKPESTKENKKVDKVIPQAVVGTTGILCVCGIVLLNSKNVKIYNLIDGEYTLVRKAHLSENKMLVDLTPYNYQSRNYKVVISKSLYKKIRGKTVKFKYFDKQYNYNIQNREFEVLV